MEIREDMLYTRDHEWILVEDDVITIGITDFAQRELGDIVYVELDSDDLVKDDVFGSIEAVKTVSDLFAPVNGKVIEFNETLEDMPDQINNDPYGIGWIVKITNFKESDLEDLLSPEEYQELTE